MKFIVKYHSEMITKSRSVRMRFCKILESNLRTVLRAIDPNVKLVRNWSFLFVTTTTTQPEVIDALRVALASTPGVDSITAVTEHVFNSLDDIAQQVVDKYRDKINPDITFCVRVRRRGKHTFSSVDVERFVGHHLGRACPRAKVRLKSPDVEVQLEIDNQRLFLIDEFLPGLGGFPIGTQDSALSLISGGYDSSVASYDLMRRGIKTHYLFFNLGGTRHEAAVREVAWYLWHRYGSSHRVRFLSVPFEPVIGEILETIREGYRGVVLKRMMLRVADQLADRLHVSALVTGESIGQVSSQTLRNLCTIDAVTQKLVLRPLIVTDKQTIIDQAKKIGTEDLTKFLPEYCGVISSRPTVDAKLERLEREETYFDLRVLDRAIEAVQDTDIRELATPMMVLEDSTIEVVNRVRPQDVVIDVRAPVEQEASPLILAKENGVVVLHIPFYRLRQAMREFDPTRRYLLYCAHGTMSTIQAAQMIQHGISLAKVYQPTAEVAKSAS